MISVFNGKTNRSMKVRAAFGLVLCGSLLAQNPPSVGTPETPFVIRHSWVIGGVKDFDWGNWELDPVTGRYYDERKGYLNSYWGHAALDSRSSQLFIAHMTRVDVFNIRDGRLDGTITGLKDASAVALDPEGQFGYIADSSAVNVAVFDRGSRRIIARIPTGSVPRALAFDHQLRLLFVLCKDSDEDRWDNSQNANLENPNGNHSTDPRRNSTILFIDADADAAHQKAIMQVVLRWTVGSLESDGEGRLYATLSNLNAIAKIDASALMDQLHESVQNGGSTKGSSSGKPATIPAGESITAKKIARACTNPRGLSVDPRTVRLFVGCNKTVVAIDPFTGEVVAAVPVEHKVESIGYDPDRRLIYAAGGGVDGTMTIIRQMVPDSFQLIQNVPTRRYANTMAADSSTGHVYLVSDYHGGIPDTANSTRRHTEDGALQVLDVGP
jgi:DNA-binding beta-propeller fold protein YncE